MFLTGLGTAHPKHRYTKLDCWNAFRASDWFNRLGRRSRAITETVLLGDNGIEARHLALDSLDEVFEIAPDVLHARFAAHAPRLASQAAARALEDAELGASEIDGIVVSTCTGYLCPGLTGYVMEALGLRQDVHAYDLVGHGCAAGLTNWQLAHALLASGQCRAVVSVCVEISSAAMYLDDDPGVLISACLFGDGAGAAVLARERPRGKRCVEWRASRSIIDPGRRDTLRFEQRDGMLRNVLTRPVPRLAAEHAERVLAQVLDEAGLTQAQIGAWIWHAGGRDVLAALARRLCLGDGQLRYSASVLRDFGNLSSAFIYFVLQAALADEAPSGWWWMSSFGAGFTCQGALLRVS